MSGFIAVGYFLFALFFSLLAFVLWARIALRYFHVSALNPVSQAIYTLTDPVMGPLTSHLRVSKKHLKRYDWPCFCVLVVVELLKFLAIGSLLLGSQLPWSVLPLYTLADLIVQPCNLLFYAILVRVIMSWVNPTWRHPIADILRLVTDPSLRFARSIIPTLAGFDIAPYVLLLFLQVITLFIHASLPLQLL
jgi:YggT family protein